MKKILFLLALLASNAYATGEYYLHGSYPAQGAAASSSAMRAELDLIQAGFDKLPTLSGNANKVCLVNSGATGLTALSSLGTTTTVLHGNASGAPTWGALSLTADVSGILPTANGGTGIAYFTAAGPTVARTYTFPDATTTVLTTNAAVTVPQGGTGTGTLTNHGVVLGQGSGTVAVTSAGTSGQVLTSNGASADPTFQSPAMVLLSTTTASAASTVDIETTFDSTYDEYVLVPSGVTMSASDQVLLRMKISGSYLTTNTYGYHLNKSIDTAATYLGAAVATGASTSILLVGNLDNASSASFNAHIYIHTPASATLSKTINWTGVAITTSSIVTASGVGMNSGTGVLTGIRIFPASGTISGKFRLYGLKN